LNLYCFLSNAIVIATEIMTPARHPPIIPTESFCVLPHRTHDKPSKGVGQATGNGHIVQTGQTEQTAQTGQAGYGEGGGAGSKLLKGGGIFPKFVKFIIILY